MLRFIFTRAILVVPAFVGVTLLTFALIRLVPGDPVLLLMGERGVSPERLAQLRTEMGFDRPMLEQYWIYVSNLLQGDFGRSIVTRTPVLKEFFALIPATIELTVAALLFAILLGLPAGVFAATRRGSAFDHMVMGASVTGYSMPIFWWGLLLILLVSVNLGWTPVSGRISVMHYIEPVTGFILIDSLIVGNWDAFVSALRHLILPAIVLGTNPLATVARMTRSSMLEVLGEDYIRTARAKGLNPLRIVWLHALRNASIPVITVIGLQMGHLLGGAILTETIFSWPGIGKWLIESIRRRDYPVLQGGVLMVASMVILVNLAVDLLYGLLNPRIRHAR